MRNSSSGADRVGRQYTARRGSGIERRRAAANSGELDRFPRLAQTSRLVVAGGERVLANILVLHGPNLNLLGEREPAIYGSTRLTDIDADLAAAASAAGHVLHSFQSNAEAALVDRVQAARGEDIAFVLVNPAGLTHTSVVLRDALAAVAIPFIEVHLSNPHAREPFRRQSYFSDLAVGIVAGFGADSYRLALEAACAHLRAALDAH